MNKAPNRKRATESAEAPTREYDFSGGVRGKYVRRFAPGGSLVTIPPDLASAFPTDKAVRTALAAYRDVRVRQLIAQLRAKPTSARQKAIRAQLRRLGHRGGLRTA